MEKINRLSSNQHFASLDSCVCVCVCVCVCECVCVCVRSVLKQISNVVNFYLYFSMCLNQVNKPFNII